MSSHSHSDYFDNRKGRDLERPMMLNQVYKPLNAPADVKGFGYKLIGQEKAGNQIGKRVDYEFETIKKHSHVKETYEQMVCLAGVGSGKSTLVSHGLQLHQQNCQHPELVEMLKDENRPLAIHITFNSDTPFNGLAEKNIEHSLIRRILAVCLDIPWDNACKLPLSDSLRLFDCLNAIVEYHRLVHDFRLDHKVFVYVGVDEINALVNHEIHSISALKALGIAFRALSIRNGYVTSIFAGTNCQDIEDSFRGTSITLHDLSLTRLSVDVMVSLLKEGGLNDNYLNHPVFWQLLRDTGYMMRAIGILVSHLEHEYNEDSINSAKVQLDNYLRDEVIQPLSKLDTQALLCYVLSGMLVNPTYLLWEGSSWTMNKLQNSGMIYLMSSDNPGRYQVYIPRIIYKSIAENKNKLNEVSIQLCKAGDRLLGLIDSYASDSMEKFVAHFHSFKKYTYLNSPRNRNHIFSVSIKAFYGATTFGQDLETYDLHLRKATVPIDHDIMQENQFPETKITADITNHWENGGVLLNAAAKGTAVDILSFEKIRRVSYEPWKDTIFAYTIKHTTDESPISIDELLADCDKVHTAFLNSEYPKNDDVIVIHFSNRVFDGYSYFKAKPKSVWITKSKINGFVGPLFGSLLTIKKQLAPPGVFNRQLSTVSRAFRFLTSKMK